MKRFGALGRPEARAGGREEVWGCGRSVPWLRESGAGEERGSVRTGSAELAVFEPLPL